MVSLRHSQVSAAEDVDTAVVADAHRATSIVAWQARFIRASSIATPLALSSTMTRASGMSYIAPAVYSRPQLSQQENYRLASIISFPSQASQVNVAIVSVFLLCCANRVLQPSWGCSIRLRVISGSLS